MNIHLISIAIEAVIVILSLMFAVNKRRFAGLGFALTFGIYVFYDLAKYYDWSVPSTTLNYLFLVASISALISFFFLYRRTA